MNPIQSNSREFLQQAVDAEIKSLEESIHVLKLRRNALSPISSLPSEIFATIFSLLCLPGIPSLGGEPGRKLRISHVCHQWREIALNQPLLWSHVDFSTLSLTGATEILVRAKSVPLYMEVRVPRNRSNDQYCRLLKKVNAHLPHIRHLSIGVEAAHICWGIETQLVLSAPILEYLSIFFQDGTRNMRDWPNISDTLFGGSTPRLSCLQLCDCDISWNSPLFKCLTSLKIVSPSRNARPELAVWLDALDGIPQLKMLTLHSASPVAPPLPFNVERTVTLPSLTHLNIRDYLGDCALAIAHLVLPALTSLCLSAKNDLLPNIRDMEEVMSYIMRHAHGPQDIQPVRSLLIRNHATRLQLLAWPLPDIDMLVHDPPAFLGATLSPRVELSIRSGQDSHRKLLGVVMGPLPLDGLVMLAAVDLDLSDSYSRIPQELTMQEFWLGHLPNWPLLRRVRLAPTTSREFLKTLLEDDGGRENPLLPSLTELALTAHRLDANWTTSLCDALTKRAEQGVPLETLDLRMCDRDPYNAVAVQLLSDIVVDILHPLDFLGPENTEKSRAAGDEMLSKMITIWEPLLPYYDDDY
jgi:hypothetical protein